MPSPAPSDLHVNVPLTNISVAYRQDDSNFVADRIFPSVPVQFQSNIFYTYTKDDWFRSIAGLRAPATETPGAGWTVSTVPYYCAVYGVHKDLDDQTRANADTTFALDRDATLWVTENLLLKRERIFLDSFMKAGVWNTTITGVAGAPGGGQFQRFDVAGSDPIGLFTTNVINVAGVTGFRMNTLVMGPYVFNALRNHAGILDRIKYTERGIVTEDLLAALFGIPNVFVTWAIENTAPNGAAAAMNFMNGKTALACYAAPNAGVMQPSAGYTFLWSGLLGAQAGGRIKRFRIEAIESDRIEGEMAFSMQIIGADLGVFFDTAVS